MDRETTRKLARAARAELDRAFRGMRLPGHPRPYFLSYLIRDDENWRIQARYGSRIHDTHDRKRSAYVDARVGSYRYDHVRDGGLFDNDKEAESCSYVDLPFGDDLEALRHGLWRLTDARYREAVADLLDKRSHHISYRELHRGLPGFERRAPAVHDGWRRFPAVDREAWAERVERLSALLRRHPEIKDSHVEFQADHGCRIFLSSEGAHVVQCTTIWALEVYLWRMSDRGDALPWTIRHTVSDPAELPDDASFARQIRDAVRTLRRLAAAPALRSFSGPALLEPVPAGLLVHEALGHRLEGNRLLSAGEGQTFRDSVGKPILPPFLSIRDDPRLRSFGGRSLVGSYAYDDEGVEAADAQLVRHGELVGFLSTRAGIARRHRSNGHARAAYHQRPISRMGVTIVEAEGGLAPRALKRRLIEEIRRQGVPYGVRIIEATSGETVTDSYNFQAFLGEVNYAVLVDPAGHETPVRGVNFIGTPFNAVRSIVAAGDTPVVDNAFCGAESGYVPVSTISPALLVRELELQNKPDSPLTGFTFPMPWERPRR